MADTRHVKGLAELQKLLDTLPVKVEKNIMRGALRAGAKVILEEAKSNVPIKTGDLRRSLRVSTRAQRQRVSAKVSSGMPIARWVEFGTRAHYIHVEESERPLNKRLSRKFGRPIHAGMTTVNRAIRSLKISGRFVGPTVHHPGAKPRPFLRPALDAKAQAAVVATAEYIKARLTKEGLDASHVTVEGDE